MKPTFPPARFRILPVACLRLLTRAGLSMAAALVSPGCLSSVPLDPKPRLAVDPAILGAWSCRSAEEEPARLDVVRTSPKTYELVITEGDKVERYPAYASVVERRTIMNVRVQEKEEAVLGTITRPWQFVHYETEGSGRLQFRALSDEAVAGVPQSERSMRRAVAGALSRPDAFQELVVCVRAVDTSPPPSAGRPSDETPRPAREESR